MAIPTPETHECLFQVSDIQGENTMTGLTGPCMICGITAEQAIKEADKKIAALLTATQEATERAAKVAEMSIGNCGLKPCQICDTRKEIAQKIREAR